MGIRKWVMPEQDAEFIRALSGETELPPLTCAILYARGYRTPQDVQAVVGGAGELGNPYQLCDIDKAVDRVRSALEEGERIAVYGDYDCDGITSTALLTSYLQSVGADVLYYIPSREKEGYGLNTGAVDVLKEQGVQLIITVDNGISAHTEIAYAATLDIDVVITDHHTPRDTLPPAVAVVNPHREDCPSPFKHLAGVGVAFKLICALEEDDGQELLEYYSDLVMLGTVADVVSLTGENRVIVKHGLEHLRETERPGLVALLELSGIGEGSISSESVAFGVIPRLNAAGRMGCVDDAVELLLTDDVSYAQELAASVSDQNEQRKKIEAEMLAEIDGILAKNPQILTHKILLVSGKNWHHGVVGIVAAKILERYGKPTILFSTDGGEARGSGRSIEGFSLIEAISACPEHLTQYGGHTLAAGLSLPADKLEDFCRQLLGYVAEHYPVMPVPSHRVDCVLKTAHLKEELLAPLSMLEPFGQGNRAPLFLMKRLKIDGVYPTADKKHIRLRLENGGESFYAVFFRMEEGRFPYHAGDIVDIVANVSLGEYNGKTQVSVKIKDLRCSGVPQDRILQEREWYARFLEDNIQTERELLLPVREDFASIYKYLRACGGFAFGAVELYYRLMSTGLGYGKLCVALDVLEEMGLISRPGRSEREPIKLIPTTQKVDIEQSKILFRLKCEGEVCVQV